MWCVLDVLSDMPKSSKSSNLLPGLCTLGHVAGNTMYNIQLFDIKRSKGTCNHFQAHARVLDLHL